MASLENQPVNTTYQSIVKLSDNGTVPATVGEQLSDGLGNLIPMKVSTNSVQFTASCQVQTPTLADHATRKDYVDAINSTLTASINAVANDLDDAEADIVTLQGDVFDLETGVGNVISVNGIAGAVTLSGGTHITLNVVGNDIEINSTGGGGGGSDSFNTFTVPSQPDVVAASGNDTMNFVDGAGISMTTNNSTKTITFDVDGLGNTPLANLFVWRGDVNGVPQAVNQSNLSVGSAITATTAGSATNAVNAQNADDALNLRVDAVTSGTYRVIVGDTGLASQAIQRLKSDVADGFTYSVSGDVVSAGAFTATNDVTAGNALIGASLDISGGADIDGTLSLGGIGNVENEINQNASDIAALQANVYSNVITHTTSPLNIDDANLSTYAGKTILIDSSASVDVELDMSTTPAVGIEFYVVRFGTGTVTAANYQGTIYSTAGIAPSARVRYSSFVVKHVGSNNWLVLGDIA